MSMVNADSVQLFAMLKKMQDSISSIETTKKSVKQKNMWLYSPRALVNTKVFN